MLQPPVAAASCLHVWVDTGRGAGPCRCTEEEGHLDLPGSAARSGQDFALCLRCAGPQQRGQRGSGGGRPCWPDAPSRRHRPGALCTSAPADGLLCTLALAVAALASQAGPLAEHNCLHGRAMHVRPAHCCEMPCLFKCPHATAGLQSNAALPQTTVALRVWASTWSVPAMGSSLAPITCQQEPLFHRVWQSLNPAGGQQHCSHPGLPNLPGQLIQ